MELSPDCCGAEHLSSSIVMEAYINEIEVEDFTDKASYTLTEGSIFVTDFCPEISSNFCSSASESVNDHDYVNAEKAASSRYYYTSTNCVACYDHDYDGLQTMNWENAECVSRINFSSCLICQSDKQNAEKLTCPALSLRKDNNIG